MRAGPRATSLKCIRSAGVALLVAACATAPRQPAANAEPERATPTLSWIAPSESVVALESPQFVFSWQNKQRKFGADVSACAVKSIVERHPGVRIISEGEFARTAFPDLPSESAPTSPESMKLLAESEVLRERIAPLNIRYLLYASAVTEVRNNKVFGGAIGGAGGGAAVAGESWDQQSDYSLAIFDMKTGRNAASQGSASGHGWFFVALVLVPLAAGWSPATESQGCQDLGNRVLATLESMTPDLRSEPP
ncbi:MAG TPA: hypothetical protein VKB68_10865 [Stellaceae bacterium]|nr:hypothetical protein [Stellaceae bacterium]